MKKLLILLFSYIRAVGGQQTLNCSNPITTCPQQSKCMKIMSTYQCICYKEFELNPLWITVNNSNLDLEYCIRQNETNVVSDVEESNIFLYLRSPSKHEHLAFRLLVVLLAAVLFTSVLYIISILRPLKRIRKLYQLMKRRRQNMILLQDIELMKKPGEINIYFPN